MMPITTLKTIDRDQAAVRPAPAAWSRRELGHLIDSAANNHQRFVRAQQEPGLTLAGCDEDVAYFYAQWRRGMTRREYPEHVILDGVRGSGVYVGMYGWHILDSIGFSQDLRVTIQALGWWPGRKHEPLTDDFVSVDYWYQVEPPRSFPLWQNAGADGRYA